jgi:hypothetical protein
VLGATIKEPKMTNVNKSQVSNDEPNDAPANPWTDEYWNMTCQAQIYRQDQAMAMRLVQEAGYKDPISAFRAHRNKPRK